MKKIFDILSPEQKPSKDFGENLAEPTRARRVSKKESQKKFLSGFWLKLILVISALFVIGIVFTVLSFKAKLTLTLKITEEPMNFQEEVGIAVSQTVPDIQNKIIPAKLFEAEKEKWQTFQSTGLATEEGKAKGIIKVYNAHTPPRSVSLVANTRFLSSEGGKIFKVPEKLYLPAAQIKNGKTTPSITEVEVVAQEGGEDYNTGPSKFSVPGLTGTALYYSIFAESTQAMEGGFKKEVKKVITEDIVAAENSLKTKLEELIEVALRNKLPEGFVLRSDLIFAQEVDVSCPQKAGEKVAEFNCQGKIKAKGLSFNLNDLKEFALKFAASKIPSTKKIREETLKLEFSSKGVLSEEAKAILEIKIGLNISEEIDQDILLSRLEGKNQKQIEEIISQDYPQVESATFKFWPFWIKKAPKDTERINLSLIF